jgi:hypothetical protein
LKPCALPKVGQATKAIEGSVAQGEGTLQKLQKLQDLSGMLRRRRSNRLQQEKKNKKNNKNKKYQVSKNTLNFKNVTLYVTFSKLWK